LTAGEGYGIYFYENMNVLLLREEVMKMEEGLGRSPPQRREIG